MARPRIHNEEMATVTFYLPKRLLAHPEHASRSELMESLLIKYQQDFIERTGGQIPGTPAVYPIDEELKGRMVAFFGTERIRFYNTHQDFIKFCIKYPGTSQDKFDRIVDEDEKAHTR